MIDAFLKRGKHAGRVYASQVLLHQAGDPRRSGRSEPQPGVIVEIQPEGSGGWILAACLEVSPGGARLVAAEALPAGTRLRLRLRERNRGALLRLDALVVWTAPQQAGAGTVTGIAFENLHASKSPSRALYVMDETLCRNVVKAMPAGIRCRMASSVEDLKAAWTLTYREYLARGYCEPHPSGMHYHAFCLLPASRTFLLEDAARLRGSLTLIVDSRCGLPMETVFPHVVASCRERWRRAAEISLLALDSGPSSGRGLSKYKRLAATFILFKAALNYARREAGVTDLLITVHPRHESLYQLFGFCAMGDSATHHHVRGSLAVPMHVDLEALENVLKPHQTFRSFFFDFPRHAEAVSSTAAVLPEDLEELVSLKWTDWKGSPERAPVEYLRRLYPDLAIPAASFSG